MKWSLGLSGLLGLSCHVAVSALTPPAYRPDIDKGLQGSYPVHSFVSSKIQAPDVNFRQWSPECDDGQYYFLTPRGWKVPVPGPMILDATGNLVWFNHFANKYGGQAYDFRVQTYRSNRYLTFWLGDDTVRGHGAGHYVMLNSSYDIVYEIGAANGRKADLHDFVITSRNTALLVIFQPRQGDVRPLGRKFSDTGNQAIWECIFQEIDIETGELLFEWVASDHLDLTLTYSSLASKVGDSGTRTNPFDWFHINSVDRDKYGNYLITARNLHSILYIDGKTKEIIWTLGGKNNVFNDLSDGHALNFAWPHHARFMVTSAFPGIYGKPVIVEGRVTRLMTVFDNAAMDWDYSYGASYSRVLLLEVTYPDTGRFNSEIYSLDATTNNTYVTNWPESLSKPDAEKFASIQQTSSECTVRVVKEYAHPQRIISSTQGSAQVLPNDRKDATILVGYGINAVVTEFSANGTVLCDMHFAPLTTWEKGDVQSYRAYKFSWWGQPREPPSAKISGKHVYISWNGATLVTEWVLQAKAANGDSEIWSDVGRAPKLGFETAIPLPEQEKSSKRTLRVVAICQPEGKPCENGIAPIVEQSVLLSLVTEHLENFHFDLFNVTIFTACFVAVALAALRICRCILRSRKSGREKHLLPRQRMD
jgi:hypothetical protein